MGSAGLHRRLDRTTGLASSNPQAKPAPSLAYPAARRSMLPVHAPMQVNDAAELLAVRACSNQYDLLN
jgi:hypothetical protein